MVHYGNPESLEDLKQILLLQSRNYPEHLSPEELASQGFVTVKHDLETLQAMNEKFPHIIAKSDGKVVGYALSMLREFEKRVPILGSLFQQINSIQFSDEPLGASNYFVMGQICVDKPFRGKGVFGKLYEKLRGQMAPHFDYVITSVALRNPRSLRAHIKTGFQIVKEYRSKEGEDWAVVLWDWG